MELFLKRYFWVVWLVFIALAASYVARTANTFVGVALEPAPVLSVDNGPRRLLTPTTRNPVDAYVIGRLFGIEPPPPPPQPGEPGYEGPDGPNTGRPGEDKDICYTCPPEKSDLRLQLLATMVANEKRWSMAMISDLDKQETGPYVLGDKIKNAVVWDIEREPQRVIIVNHDTRRLEYVDAIPGSGQVNTAGLASLGTAPVPTPGDKGDEGIQQKSENDYEISRDTLNNALGDLNSLATQARIVPSFKNGQANGFKLFSIRPGSLYSQIGIQNGDVITRINGYDINSPDKALEIYTRLKDAQNIEVQVERRGQVINKRYSIN